MSFLFGNFVLDQERRQLLRHGKPVPLEPKAFELLGLLLDRRPRVLSKGQLRDALWPGIVVGETSLPRLVAELRQALGDEAHRPRFIRTAHGFGYAFCGEARLDGHPTPPTTWDHDAALGEARPYPGLSAFTEADAGQFFGRETEVAALWEKLRRQKLLAVIGPSGAGKTSFLRAGVIPARPPGWSTAHLTPGASPLAALARALTPALAGDPESLAELVQGSVELVQTGDDERLVSAASRWRLRTNGALLAIDQFEELFTLNVAETQERFAGLLGRLTEETGVCVLLSLRDDFLFRCHGFPSLAAVFHDVTPLGPPSAEALHRALVEPAACLGVRFEDPALVEEMVASVEKERGALPLLAFAAARLWEERDREKSLLTRAAYRRVSGVEGALAEHAETTLRQLGPERERQVREVFRNLVTAEGTRATRERDDLLSVFAVAGSQREEAEAIVDVLVGARLLTEYDDPDGPEGRSQARIEIVHESLLTHWPRLERWRAQDEDGALLRDQLRQAARLWDEKGRPQDLLWTGRAYREYRLWRERYPGRLSAVEEAFTRAMSELVGRRRRRKRMAFAALLAAALGVALVTFWLWRRSETSRQEAEAEARRAEASKLLALGQRELATDPTAAAAYALKSVELADTEVGRMFAVRVLQNAPTMIMTPADLPPGLETRTARFSPNGEWLALGGHGRLQLLPRDGGRPMLLGDYVGTGPRIAIGFGPANDVLVANRRGDLRVWSLPDGRELRRGALEEGPSELWVRANGFLTSTTAGRHAVLRWWPFAEGRSRLLGSMEPSGVADASRQWLAYAHGRRVFLRSLEDWTSPPRLLAEHAAEVGDPERAVMAFSLDGERLAVFDASGEIRIWSTREPLTRPVRVLQAREMSLADLTFAADGGKLALGGTKHGRPTVRIWDLQAPPAAEPLVLRRGGSHSLTTVAFDPSGHWIVTGHLLRGAAFWPLEESHPHVIARHEGDVRSIAFTGDGQRLVSSSEDGTVRVWPLSPAVGGERRWLIGSRVAALAAVDPTFPQIAATGAGRVRVLPLQGGPPRDLEGSFSDYKGVAVAFGEGGRLVAAAGGPPMTDLSKTPLHKRPYQQFLAAIQSHTNVRAVSDPQSPTGWKLEAGPFPGWAKRPEH